MKKRLDTTFVQPWDSTQPAQLLPPAGQVHIVPPDSIDVSETLPGQHVRVVEHVDAMTSAQAFLVKYAGLTLILIILAIGATKYFALGTWTGVLLFAGLAITGYWALALMENHFTTIGTERLRIKQGARILRDQVKGDTQVRLAQVQAQREVTQAQREYNRMAVESARARAQAQLEQHERAQSSCNRLHNYAPARLVDTSPAWNVAELAPPAFLRRQDAARSTLLAFVTELYERDAAGDYVRIYADGRIRRETRIPFGSRGGLTPAVRQQCVDLLHQLDSTGAWLLRYDDTQRLWRLNVRTYPDVQDAISALGAVHTVDMSR